MLILIRIIIHRALLAAAGASGRPPGVSQVSQNKTNLLKIRHFATEPNFVLHHEIRLS